MECINSFKLAVKMYQVGVRPIYWRRLGGQAQLISCTDWGSSIRGTSDPPRNGSISRSRRADAKSLQADALPSPGPQKNFILEPAEEPPCMSCRRAPFLDIERSRPCLLADLEPPATCSGTRSLWIIGARLSRVAHASEHRVGYPASGPPPYRPGDRHPVEAVDHGLRYALPAGIRTASRR